MNYQTKYLPRIFFMFLYFHLVSNKIEMLFLYLSYYIYLSETTNK